MSDSKEMQAAFKDWVNPDTGWEYPSPYTGFAKAWGIQEDKIYLLESRLEKSNKKVKQLQTHLNLAVEALNQLERILTYDDNYNGTDMLKIIREARK